LFEIVQHVKQINSTHKRKAAGHEFESSSYSSSELTASPNLELDYIVAMCGEENHGNKGEKNLKRKKLQQALLAI